MRAGMYPNADTDPTPEGRFPARSPIALSACNSDERRSSPNCSSRQAVLSRMIACEEHFPLVCIENGKGEHAAQAPHAIVFPLLVGMNNGFGIRMCLEDVSRIFEYDPQLPVVVDLPVEGDPDRLISLERGCFPVGRSMIASLLCPSETLSRVTTHPRPDRGAGASPACSAPASQPPLPPDDTCNAAHRL